MGIFWRSVKNLVQFPCNFQDTKRAASVCLSTTCGFLSAVRGEPVSKTQLLSMSKEYADALGLAENKRLVNILGFDDFIREENRKDGKRHKVSEDYIHSFIAEHERDYEPEEE